MPPGPAPPQHKGPAHAAVGGLGRACAALTAGTRCPVITSGYRDVDKDQRRPLGLEGVGGRVGGGACPRLSPAHMGTALPTRFPPSLPSPTRLVFPARDAFVAARSPRLIRDDSATWPAVSTGLLRACRPAQRRCLASGRNVTHWVLGGSGTTRAEDMSGPGRSPSGGQQEGVALSSRPLPPGSETLPGHHGSKCVCLRGSKAASVSVAGRSSCGPTCQPSEERPRSGQGGHRLLASGLGSGVPISGLRSGQWAGRPVGWVKCGIQSQSGGSRPGRESPG